MSAPRRFRSLTREELEGLELEFARFLASQGMPAQEWARLSKEEPGKVEALIEEFSTLFWETTTSRLTYLERHDSGDTWFFKFGETSASVVRIDPEGTRYRGQKSFPEEARGQEVFLVLEQGATPVHSDQYEDLDELFSATA
ncbi:MAG: DUF6495 family protein [Bacteroidetes bacterium]|nr:DUF6495 family protein [Bacteroidota bacterium]MDA0903879.1 DUF6495 family protein [Bacteroidota bacterium]MDA1243178.1 DUF6495 family protein [Bacteroidota bacterium]